MTEKQFMCIINSLNQEGNSLENVVTVHMKTGIPEEEQQGSFMNATLQSAGKTAFSIATYIDIPNADKMSESQVAKHISDTLGKAVFGVKGLRFEVQTGRKRE